MFQFVRAYEILFGLESLCIARIFRTLEYLARHLHQVAESSDQTGMTAKNLAIVWAPNLLRRPETLEGGLDALQSVGVQAVVTE